MSALWKSSEETHSTTEVALTGISRPRKNFEKIQDPIEYSISPWIFGKFREEKFCDPKVWNLWNENLRWKISPRSSKPPLMTLSRFLFSNFLHCVFKSNFTISSDRSDQIITVEPTVNLRKTQKNDPWRLWESLKSLTREND